MERVSSDAVADPSLIAHDHSLNVTLPQLAEVGTTADILAALDRRS